MTTRVLAWRLAALVTAALIFVPAAAHAAAPYSSPRTLRAMGFESGQPTFDTIEPMVVDALPASAYWGTTGSVRRTGSFSLWCAGTDALGLPRPFGAYLPDTRGRATVKVPELADHYSGRVTFYYLLPSAGAEDWFGFSMQRLDSNGDPVFPSAVLDYKLPRVAAWTARTYYPGAGSLQAVSRQPMQLGVWFQDGVEGATNLVGQGPAVDDLYVSGYRFGPVKALQSRWSTSPAGVELTWQVPQRSAVDSTPEDRPVVYRVWRSAAGADSWKEVTPSAGVTETSLVDTSAATATFYDYSVQAWDPTGTSPRGWGVQSSPLRVATYGAVWMSSLSGVPSSVRYGSTFAAYGTLRPRHTGGYPVRILAYRYSGTRVVQRVTLTAYITNSGQPATQTKYYRYVRLPARGVWRLRPYHSAHDGEKAVVGALSRAVTVR